MSSGSTSAATKTFFFTYIAIIRLLIAIKRIFRKHRLALLLAAVYLFILFFPVIFLDRVLSPNDVYFSYDPWATARQVEAQNPTIHDPPVAYYPLISLLRDDPSSFHWNRYVASGIPGFGSAAAAVLSPFVLIPALVLPLASIYGGMIAAKFLGGFFLAYWWLREERLGKSGAAIGALLFSAFGSYAVWWLWQSTNATALYPAVLLVIARAFHGKRNSITAMAILGVALLLSGFPAAIAYIAYVALLYAAYLAIRRRGIPLRNLAAGGVAVILSLMIAAPFLAPMVTLLRSSGYFEIRQQAGYDFHYPLEHLKSFLQPFRLGDPSAHLWIGDSRLAISNNFIEATVYAGMVAVALVPLGLFALRGRHRFFWSGLLLVLLFCMFGEHQLLKDAVGELPGLKYSPLTRLRVLIALPVAYLAAAAVSQLHALVQPRRFRELALSAVGLIAAVDLSLFAARFYPFITTAATGIPRSETVDFLRQMPLPFRILPFFSYLIPNTAELVRLEDVRSHFGSELRYRELLGNFDPEGWGGNPTVMMFNPLHANINDPVLSMVNVRYLVEPLKIDILRWRILEQSSMSSTPVGEMRIRDGETVRRTIAVDQNDLYAIDLNFTVAKQIRPTAAVTVSIIRPETGKVLVSRRWSARRLQRDAKTYIPLVPHARAGNVILLQIRAEGLDVLIPVTSREQPRSLLFGKVRTPLVPLQEFRDGRVFENLTALPRHWAVWESRQVNAAGLLTASADFSREVLFSKKPDASIANLSKVAPAMRRVDFRLLEYSGARHVLETRSAVPFFLATSEKLTPELEIAIDGKSVSPREINGVFAGVRVGPGSHRIELSRRIGRPWVLTAASAAILFVFLAIYEFLVRRR